MELQLQKKENIKSLLAIDSLSPLDMYVSIYENELDHTDWAILLSNLENEELRALSAIHAWHKYNFDPRAFAELLDYAIYDKDRFRAYRNLKKFSYDELLLFLSKIVKLEWYQEDTDYPDDLFLTEDRVFLVYKKDDTVSDVLYNKAISTINLKYLDSMQEGRKLCLDVMATNTDIKEEELLHIKDYTLENLGIKPYQETMQLYHYENPVIVLKKLQKKLKSLKSKKHQMADFIANNLPEIIKEYSLQDFIPSDLLRNDIKVEFYSILSSILVYNDVLKYGRKIIKDTVKRNLSYLKLGINIALRSTNNDLAKILENTKLSELFRLGFSSLLELKRYANTIKAIISQSPKTIIITPDEEAFLDALTDKLPSLKLKISEPKKNFSSVEELKIAKTQLDNIKEKLVS